MASLVIAEHDNTNLKDATHKTVTAAAAVSTPVHVLVAGENCAAVAEAAARIAGVELVLLADAPLLARQLAEPMESLILSLADGYDAILAPATTTGKNILPRVAAKYVPLMAMLSASVQLRVKTNRSGPCPRTNWLRRCRASSKSRSDSRAILCPARPGLASCVRAQQSMAA